MSATRASELHMIPIEWALFKTWLTCPVLSLRKMPDSALPNMALNAEQALCFPNLPAKILQICTALVSDNLIIHCNYYPMFKDDDWTRNFWQNSVVPNASMNNRHRFLLSELLRAEKTDWMLFRTIDIRKIVKFKKKQKVGKEKRWERKGEANGWEGEKWGVKKKKKDGYRKWATSRRKDITHVLKNCNQIWK